MIYVIYWFKYDVINKNLTINLNYRYYFCINEN